MLGKMDVKHGNLVGYHQIGVQHGRFAKLAVRIRKQAQCFMDGGSLLPGGLLHASCRAARRRTAHDGACGLELLVDLQYEPLDHGFARTRAAGYDADGRAQAGLHGLLLL